MKKILTLASFIAIYSANISYAGEQLPATLDKITVGNQPAYIFGGELKDYSRDIYVLCLGNDSNYDGIQDEGEEVPSLWLIDSEYGYNQNAKAPQKVMDFPFNSLQFPLRPSIDTLNKTMYLVENSNLVAYNYKTQEKKLEIPIDTMSSAVCVDNNLKFAFVSVSPYGVPGYVKKYDLEAKNVVDSIPSGVGVRQIIQRDNQLIVLTEGVFGSDDAKISFFDLADEKSNLKKEILVGNTANHMTISDNELYVTVNGSHKVVIIDLEKFEVTGEIKVPTSGYDGPREASVRKDKNGKVISITTYAGNVYFGQIDKLVSGEAELDFYTIKGKTESVLYANYFENDPLFVSVINEPDYTPANYVLRFGTISVQNGVNEISSNTLAYPNPTNDMISINLDNSICENAYIEILALDGKKVAAFDSEISNGKIQFSSKKNNLSSGAYLVVVKVKDNKFYSKIIVK